MSYEETEYHVSGCLAIPETELKMFLFPELLLLLFSAGMVSRFQRFRHQAKYNNNCARFEREGTSTRC